MIYCIDIEIFILQICPFQFALNGKSMYNETCVWETTATRNHLSWKTIYCLQKVLHFNYVIKPVTKDRLSWKTIFVWPMRWSFKAGCTALVHCMLLIEKIIIPRANSLDMFSIWSLLATTTVYQWYRKHCNCWRGSYWNARNANTCIFALLTLRP